MDVLIMFPFVLACAVSDLKTKRIPNTLIVCGLAGAILARTALAFGIMSPNPVSSGSILTESIQNSRLLNGGILNFNTLSKDVPGASSPSSVLLSLADGCAGFLLPWILIGPLAALKMFGGGDVKLLSVIGLWLGARSSLLIMWYSLLAAAAWSVVLVVRKRNLSQRLNYLYRYAGHTIVTKKASPYRTGTAARSGKSFSDVCVPANSGNQAKDSKDSVLSSRNTLAGSEDRSGEFCFAVPVLIALIFWMSFGS